MVGEKRSAKGVVTRPSAYGFAETPERYAIPPELVKNIAGIEQIVDEVVA